MKKIFLIIITITIFVTSYAQKNKITGNWLLVKIEINGEIQFPYQTFSFEENGTFSVLGIEMGTWKLTNKKIVLESQKVKDFNGHAKIIKINRTDLILEKDKMKFFYSKLNNDKIAEFNDKANIQGVWKLKNELDEAQYIKFELPNKFTMVSFFDGGSSTINGDWIYSQKEESLIIISFSNSFNGKYTFLKQNDKEFEADFNGSKIKALKVDMQALNIEKLEFTADDINNKGTNEIPYKWAELYEGIQALSTIKGVVYRKGSLINKIGVFDYSEIIIDIKASAKDEIIEFSYKTTEGNDTIQYKQEIKDRYSHNVFFPEQEYYEYKIVGNELITIPAGIFNCTVIETIGDSDNKFKYWMINDKPGIYAKIIKSGTDVFNNKTYTIETLKRIITK